MRIDDIQAGRRYQRIDDPARIVKVTSTGDRVAYDIPGRDHRGHPTTSQSAMRADRFAQLHQPYDD